MKRRILLEGLLLFVISAVALAEGARLAIYKDALAIYDPLGPGLYIVLLGMLLMAISIFHLAINYRNLSHTDLDRVTH